MEDIKAITKNVKECLKQYGFKQKGTSREFFYDCNWYVIIAQLDKTAKSIIVLNGIKFLWHYDERIPVREVTKDDLLFHITESSPFTIENACKWIDSKKELFKKLYENPTNFLSYFRERKDAHRYPHDYILARMLCDSAETTYFEKQEQDHLNEVNNNPAVYFTYNAEKSFRIREADVNHIMRLEDDDFIREISSRITENRKKLKLETFDKYF